MPFSVLPRATMRLVWPLWCPDLGWMVKGSKKKGKKINGVVCHLSLSLPWKISYAEILSRKIRQFATKSLLNLHGHNFSSIERSVIIRLTSFQLRIPDPFLIVSLHFSYSFHQCCRQENLSFYCT